jgi:N6-adenosine-specific RNA methylase IME4
MSVPEIRALMRSTLDGIVARDAHLYLWATNNFLAEGLEVLSALGFRYVTNVAWVKPRIGIGQYFRGQHELCLFGVRGKGFAVRTLSRNLPSVIVADHRRSESGKRLHSGKPEEFYRLVESRSSGPRIELFARRRRVGWTTAGDDPALSTEEVHNEAE